MGKSAKLFKSLVSGVKAFKSPSKEKSVKEPASTAHTREDKRHGGKDKCMWSLGKSSSRSRDAYAVAAAASSPETIEIKCVEVDSEKLKDVLPIPTAEACVESSGPVKAHATSVNPCHGTTIGMLQQTCPAESAMASEQKERAAAKIQATFRCYLAQRAFRALRALVRLQALARGRIVRKQALSSLRCMQALIRVQALSRGHRVRNSELGQVVQKHLQQARQSRMKKPAEGWVNTMSTSQQLHQRAQSKQDAAIKRQRALVAVLSEQLNKDTLKQSPSIECDEELKKSHWAWSWLERWTVASTSVISRTSMAERHTVADKSMAKEKVIVEPGNKHKESFKKEVKKASDILNSPVKAQEKTLVAVKREEKVKTPTETEKMVKREEKVKMVTDTEKVVKREERVKTSTETDKVGLKKANLFGSSSAVPAKSMSPAVPSAPLSSLKDEASALKDEVCASKETSLRAEKPSISSMVVAGSEGSDETLPTLGTESMATNASSAPDTRSPTVREIEEAYPNATDSQSKSPILSTADTCDDGTRLSLPNRSMYPYLSSESLLPSDPPACLEELTTPNDLPHGTSVPEMLEMPETILSPKGGEAAQSVSEAVEVTNEDLDVKDEEEAIHIGTSPDINGGCDASVTSFDEKSVKSSIKVSVLAGSKHDAHVEDDSPAFLPSYMATTKSSKAKVRTPKQKSSDSPKQKADSPKPKLDSPKLKTESPKPRLDPITPKPDSVTKRRHSLSALDGKMSPATQTPKQTMQTMHVRVNSRGYLKDMSIDGAPLSNGGGSGRQRK